MVCTEIEVDEKKLKTKQIVYQSVEVPQNKMWAKAIHILLMNNVVHFYVTLT